MKTAPLACALAATLLASAALAYVLPSSSILRRLAEKRDDLRLSQLRLTGTANFRGAGAKDAGAALNVPGDREVQTELILSLKLPGRCRAEVKVPEGTGSASVTAHAKKRTEGKEIATLSVALSQICPTLALRSASESEARDGLERYLKSLGIDSKTTSLARFEGQIAYVIGDPAPGSPQFWIYKDSFLPARVMFADAAGTKWDVRFRSYNSPVAGDWFPRLVEVARGEELLMRFTALSADASVKLADNLF